MGFAPPTNFPAPGATALSASQKFATPEETITLPCGIAFTIPGLSFFISVALPFEIPALPNLNLHFKLSCNLDDPVDVSAHLTWGAGATSNAPADPNDDENQPTFSPVSPASSNTD